MRRAVTRVSAYTTDSCQQPLGRHHNLIRTIVSFDTNHFKLTSDWHMLHSTRQSKTSTTAAEVGSLLPFYHKIVKMRLDRVIKSLQLCCLALSLAYWSAPNIDSQKLTSVQASQTVFINYWGRSTASLRRRPTPVWCHCEHSDYRTCTYVLRNWSNDDVCEVLLTWHDYTQLDSNNITFTWRQRTEHYTHSLTT